MAALFTFNSPGVVEVLKQAHKLTTPMAQRVAGAIRQARPGVEVVVDDYVTDRAASSVTVKDPRAMGWQARDGLLTKAAASQGLTVRARKR